MKLRVHKAKYGTDSYLTLDDERVPGVSALYVSEVEGERNEVYVSLILSGDEIDVVELPEPEDEIKQLREEVAQLQRERERGPEPNNA